MRRKTGRGSHQTIWGRRVQTYIKHPSDVRAKKRVVYCAVNIRHTWQGKDTYTRFYFNTFTLVSGVFMVKKMEFMNSAQVAKVLGLSLRRVQELAAAGIIRNYRPKGLRKIIFVKKDVAQYIGMPEEWL